MINAFPRYCIFRGVRCRVLSYEGDGRFRVLPPDDSPRTVGREFLIFVER